MDRSRAQKPWKVNSHTPASSPVSFCTRSFISLAALLVKVRARIW